MEIGFDATLDANGNLTNKEIAITKAEMEQLRDNLVEAEKAKRKGEGGLRYE